MGARVLLVAFKGSPASAWVKTMEAHEYIVFTEVASAESGWRTANERGIDVVIIDGAARVTAGRQAGQLLRDTVKTRDIRIIWTNLSRDDTDLVLAEVRPDMTVIAPKDAVGVLAALEIVLAKAVPERPKAHVKNSVPKERVSSPASDVTHAGDSRRLRSATRRR